MVEPSIREHAQAALEALDSIGAHPDGVVKFARGHLREILLKLQTLPTLTPIAMEVATMDRYREIEGQRGILLVDENGPNYRILNTARDGWPWLPPAPGRDDGTQWRTVTITDPKQAYLVEEIHRLPGADWQVVEIRFKRGEPVRVYDRPIGSVAKALALVEED